MRNKKIKKYYIILIIISILLLIFSIIINDKRELTFIEKTMKDISLIENRILMKPTNYIKDKIKKYSSLNKIYKKYAKLEKKYNKKIILESKLDEKEKEITDLKKILELNKTLSSATYVNATIINRNIGYFYDTLTIDKGKKNKINKNMAVINNEGLVGIVSKTTNYNSTVKLLTTETENKMSVKIKIDDEKYVYGLLSGYNREKKYFIIDGISENTDIKLNSVVTTTGLGSDIPSGILIGKVEKIEKDNFDLTRRLLVKSSVNFDNLNYVSVVRKEG